MSSGWGEGCWIGDGGFDGSDWGLLSYGELMGVRLVGVVGSVEEISGHMKSLDPKGGGKVSLKQERTNDIVDGSNHAFCFAILLRGFPSPTCTDGNKRVLKSVLKLFELEFKWEEAVVSMFHVGSCKSQASVKVSFSCWEKARISLRSQSNRAGGKNQLIKAVRSSFHVLRVPSLSLLSQVFASPMRDRGNIIRRTALFSVSLYLTWVKWLPLMVNSFAVSRMVIAELGVGATTRSAAHMGSSSFSPQVVSAAKLPILNLNEFDLWKMRTEQYFLMTDYSLWEVILNARKNELKAQGTLLMALPDKHQLKFNIHKDAKTLIEAIEKRFGGNTKTKKTKKVQKTLLKQQYENFTGSSSESLDQIHDMLQKLIMRARLVFQRTGRNLREIGPTSMGFDMSKVECYNCHRKGHFARECRSPKDTKRNSAAEPQRRNVPVETSTSNALVSQFACSKACTKAYATLQSHYDKLTDDFRKSQFDVISYKTGLESIEARLLVYQQNKTVFEEDIKLLKFEFQLRDNALVVLRQNLEKEEQEKDDLKLKLEKFHTFFKNLSQLLASQTSDKTGLGYNAQVFTRFMFDYDDYFTFESDESLPPSPIYDRNQSRDGYHVVLPPYTGTFMLPKPDLVFHNAPNDVETVHTVFNVELSPAKPDTNLSHTHRPSAPIIEDWVSDSEDESETKIPQNVSSFVQPTEEVKSLRPSVQHVETSIPTVNPKTAIPNPTSNGNRRNRKACFVCKSLDNLIKDCDSYEKKMAQTTARNHAKMGNHKQYANMSLTNPQKHVVPTVVLTKSTLVPISAARPVTTVVSKYHVTRPRPAKPIITKPHSPPRRHINRSPSLKASNFPPNFTVVKALMVNAAKELNGGYVAFGGIPKGGKISGKEKAGEESTQQYVLFLVWSSGSTSPQNTDDDAALEGKEPEFKGRKPESEVHVSPSRYKNLSAEFKDFSADNINEVNAAGSPVPTVRKSSCINTSRYSDDQNMPELKDITYSDDEEDVGGKADFTNLETLITVSPIPTTRVHKDHHVTQIIGDLSSATQTRSMKRVAKDQGGLSQINNDDFHTCMFACFLSQKEPKREEGIDYKEVFAPVARIEAITLFLAYASFIGFMVYQIDVKSAFLYGTIGEEVYVYQPPGFEDPDHPDKVYKVVKALYELHQAPRACKAEARGIFISQDKYVAEILRKFGLTDRKLASTPIDTEKPLLKDPD
nr:putative ribonuclease H-like domain-containing protein [Tanacetum cinerariifolium]